MILNRLFNEGLVFLGKYRPRTWRIWTSVARYSISLFLDRIFFLSNRDLTWWQVEFVFQTQKDRICTKHCYHGEMDGQWDRTPLLTESQTGLIFKVRAASWRVSIILASTVRPNIIKGIIASKAYSRMTQKWLNKIGFWNFSGFFSKTTMLGSKRAGPAAANKISPKILKICSSFTNVIVL